MNYKYALKVAIGGAFIAALFRDSDLANVMFPALGLLSALQPDLASTIKNGCGLLLGSAIGGLIGGLILTAFGSGSLADFFSLSPFLGALGFSLAAITCESLQLSSAYTQAGFVAFLLTTGQAATPDPWLYTYVRVSTNWIGVAIAVGIIFVFRDSDPREQLKKNLSITLGHIERVFSLIVRNQETTEKAEIPKFLAQINQIATANTMLLSKATYGFLGNRLQQENWGQIIAHQRNLGRHLGEMLKVSDAGSVQSFQTELIQFSEQVSLYCEQLTQTIKQETPLANDLISIAIAENKNLPPALLSSSLSDIEKFSVFAFSLQQFDRELNQLADLISHLGQPLVQDDPQLFSWRFFHFKPLPLAQLRYILAIGISMGFALGLMRNLFATEPLFAYLGTLGVLIPILPIFTYGSVSLGRLFLIPPLIGFILVIFLTMTLGNSPFVVGLGLFISTLICYRLKLGFLSSAGASLVVISYFIPLDLYVAALLNILLGMFLGSLAISLFKVGDPAAKLKQSLTAVFENLGNFYALVCQSYQHGIDNQQATAQMSHAIAKLLQTQPLLKILSNQTMISSPFAEDQQKQWMQLITSEQILFNHLTELQAIAQESVSKDLIGIPPELLSEFELLCQMTTAQFKEISMVITEQNFPRSLDKLESQLATFERILSEFCQQQNSQDYSLEKIVLFLAFCLHLKAITQEQIELRKQG